ncbi:MAG: hypothetical protein QOC92_1200 [Acidimicrobiaceae bacterium]|jgi:hypothetical protein
MAGEPDIGRGSGVVTRRSVLGGATLAVAGLATGGLTLPARAATSRNSLNAIADAKPTRPGIVGPGGVGWHLGGVGRGTANSSIFDFSGAVAGADIRGPGLLFPSGVVDEGPAIPIEFDADVRLMKGSYIDRGGREQQGAFAFI